MVESSSSSSSQSAQQQQQQRSPQVRRDLPPRRVAEQLFHSQSDDHDPYASERHLAVSSHHFRIVVEGHAPPLFVCNDDDDDEDHRTTTTTTTIACADEIRVEQEALWQLVKSQCQTAKLVRRNDKILNALTVQIPQACVTVATLARTTTTTFSSAAATLSTQLRSAQAFVQSLRQPPPPPPGNRHHDGDASAAVVPRRVYVSSHWQPANFIQSVEHVGGTKTTRQFCLKGRGVRVAVLDSGVDYTHQALSGNGTLAAYVAATADVGRDGLFPTPRVVDGYDFVGDVAGSFEPNRQDGVDYGDDDFARDDDPIDEWLGHGTGVAHAVLGVAGQAELLGFKVCIPSNQGCPDTAIISAIEYALDPNQDGDTADHVDIINLSLGSPYSHPYYSAVAQAIETAFALGVLTVVAAGNFGNRPGIIFQVASSPNALAVGATQAAETAFMGGMADYSSRGPSASSPIAIKPDLVAPGGPFDLAASGTGHVYHKGVKGTSYSAPLVTGAAALVKERCPECSPFAIKCILMNNAVRNVRYLTVDSSKVAPISWAGAGELQVYNAITADFWAYNLVDSQPSVSLGVLNVAKDMAVSKTIRVQVLDLAGGAVPLSVKASFVFRDPAKAKLDILKVSFFPETFELNRRSCGITEDVIVTFAINAKNVPSNHMTSSGEASIDPVASLDPNELDGWIIFTSQSNSPKKVSVPFYTILRKAAHVLVDNTVLPTITPDETVVRLGLENVGVGVAQIDTFELVHESPDDAEQGFGNTIMPADFRFIGYRTVFVGEPTCDYLVEFAFNSWETIVASVNTFFEAHIDVDNDGGVDVILSNRGPQQHKTNYTECRVLYTGSSEWSCAGYAPDHAGYSSNIVTRACSNDLGLTASPATTFQVRFTANSYSRFSIQTDTSGSDFYTLMFPNPALAGPSFDLNPGTTWSDIVVTGPGVTPDGDASRGLLLMTNSYRNPTSTGASTKETETIVITREGTNLFLEKTPDRLTYPKANRFDGPFCETWFEVGNICSLENPAIDSVLSFDEIFGQPDQPNNNGPVVNGETCVENATPQLQLSTRFPTDVPTSSPTSKPTSTPTTEPTDSPTSSPATSSPTRQTTLPPTEESEDGFRSPQTPSPSNSPNQQGIDFGQQPGDSSCRAVYYISSLLVAATLFLCLSHVPL